MAPQFHSYANALSIPEIEQKQPVSTAKLIFFELFYKKSAKKFAHVKKKPYLCSRFKNKGIVLARNTISALRALGQEILPEGSRLWLYGSRARGDEREDSDWDLLLLLNKDRLDDNDFNTLSYPFIELGLDQGQYFSTQMYTQKDWQTMSFMPFYKNVEHDKVVII